MRWLSESVRLIDVIRALSLGIHIATIAVEWIRTKQLKACHSKHLIDFSGGLTLEWVPQSTCAVCGNSLQLRGYVVVDPVDPSLSEAKFLCWTKPFRV